ncbi:GNAT family N-acetyltransferase [Burkholderia plantarii]|uniref:GNAT family N-acetyltransferase n=1 Tax=Burkholderia plantarii TaxID=41899 RepID=UPI0006D8D4C5|nr:GNAT family protein [Burkholderia plantarii]ALK33203.1 GCN5-like N-acetyltransferase [Burkholderia plantarii]GLZ22956.1 N-acetyltransferase [Burkholderia plantarii]
MSTRTNEHGQPIGPAVEGWTARALPAAVTLEGRYCRLEPLDAARHADDLAAAYLGAPDGRDWTYLFVGPFASVEAYRSFAESAARSTDPRHYAVIDRATGRAVGTLALMRQDPAHGVIEVGSVTFSPDLKRTPLSTEAQYLLMAYAFDTLGYRRYEWKCDSLNAPSRHAAERLGFSFEGIFRQAIVYKGRSRDTAWYSIIDTEWPRVKRALDRWLAPENFDADGRQRRSLAELRDTAG